MRNENVIKNYGTIYYNLRACDYKIIRLSINI